MAANQCYNILMSLNCFTQENFLCRRSVVALVTKIGLTGTFFGGDIFDFLIDSFD